MPKMKTSFKGLVQLLAKSLYPEPDVFIRELVQNAHDSIKFRKVDEPLLQGLIEIFSDKAACTITFVDNGKGMNKEDIEDFLSTIGRSGTGESKGELASQNIAVETIGQFGIGLLSAFVVAEQIDVYTRKIGNNEVWHWYNTGDEEYLLDRIEMDDMPVGTKVVVKIGSDHLRHIDEEHVRETVKKYADFIPYNIMLNGNGPVNTVNAPWHRGRGAFIDDKDYEKALYNFLNERYPDMPLHIIPVNTTSPRAKGALYISDRHVYSTGTSGMVDIFQERMAIRMRDQELLPEWAKFITGVIDSSDLHPTAARDNIMKNDNYFELRKALGGLIIQSLIDLSRSEKSKFFRICKWHHFHLKGMARKHEEFFNAVIDHLPFETNKGEMTLKDYMGRQSYKPGEKVPVYFFSYGYDSNQFFELCDARGILTINTGRTYDETLIRRYVERYSEKFELKQMDHLDDPYLFERLDKDEHAEYYALESAIRRALEHVGLHRVRPVARKFKPLTMSAAIISTQKIEAYEKMESLLEQPFMIEGLGELAEEMTEELRKQPMELFLNVNNELIQALLQVEDLDAERFQPILIGIYNNAILYSQHRMTQENLKVFYHQMQKQMLSTLNLEAELERISREKADLQMREMERSRQEKAHQQTSQGRQWIRLFVMMPYEKEFDQVEEALMDILQSPPYFFELELARSRQREKTTKKNIQSFIQDADGYIADISTHSPNVMMELGWIFFEPSLQERLQIILRSEKGKDRPVDMAELLCTEYPSADDRELVKVLTGKFEKHEHLQQLANRIKQGELQRFLSPHLFRDVNFLSEHQANLLCKTFKTVEEVINIREDEFTEKLSAEKGDDDLPLLLSAIQNKLKKL